MAWRILFSGIRTVGLYDTGDLSGYHDVVIERTLKVGKELVDQGAEAIIPLGGKIYPYVVTPEELAPHLGVPVINTKAVGVSYAELMARNKIQHSIKAYPCPTGLDPDAVSATLDASGCRSRVAMAPRKPKWWRTSPAVFVTLGRSHFAREGRHDHRR